MPRSTANGTRTRECIIKQGRKGRRCTHEDRAQASVNTHHRNVAQQLHAAGMGRTTECQIF